MADPRPPIPRRTISCANDPENPASTLLAATIAIGRHDAVLAETVN
jgi:hypothetical protein